MDNNTTRVRPCHGLQSKIIRWKILGGLFASLLVIGWIFIIVILIQEEKWQLVLVAWLLLYAAAHFCYWYFKRHHLLSLHSHICGRNRGAIGSVTPVEKTPDIPPSYDDILKSEPPPPEYYSVVLERPRGSSSKPTTPRKQLSRLALQSLPKVFGRTPSVGSLSVAAPAATSSTRAEGEPYKGLNRGIYVGGKRFERRPPSSVTTAPTHTIAPHTISASLPEQQYNWRAYKQHNIPPPRYEEFEPDAQSRVVNFHSFSPSRRRRSSVSTLRPNSSSLSDEICPIFSPIYRANSHYPSSRSHTPISPSVNGTRAETSQNRANNSELEIGD